MDGIGRAEKLKQRGSRSEDVLKWVGFPVEGDKQELNRVKDGKSPQGPCQVKPQKQGVQHGERGLGTGYCLEWRGNFRNDKEDPRPDMWERRDKAEGATQTWLLKTIAAPSNQSSEHESKEY